MVKFQRLIHFMCAEINLVQVKVVLCGETVVVPPAGQLDVLERTA